MRKANWRTIAGSALAILSLMTLMIVSAFSVQSEVAAQTTENITINNFAFSPNILTVTVGTKVVWTNKQDVSHTVTSDTGKTLDSPLIKPTTTFEFTFKDAGTFDYHCEPHPNMKAKIVVMAAGAGSTGAQATTAAATTAAATTAAATTAAATTAAATTAAATTAAATTAPATTAAAQTGAKTKLPLYSPNKAVTFSDQFMKDFDDAFRKGAGGAITGANYDFFITPDGDAKVSAYYDGVMKAAGYDRASKTDASSAGLKGTAYIYAKGSDARGVLVMGPLSAEQANSLKTQTSSGGNNIAANDNLIVLISDIKGGQGGAPSQPPTTGFGGAGSDGGFNPLWLLVPLGLAMAMAMVALVTRRRTAR